MQSDKLRACCDAWEKMERLKRTGFLPGSERRRCVLLLITGSCLNCMELLAGAGC